jgi:hypothetical protein
MPKSRSRKGKSGKPVRYDPASRHGDTRAEYFRQRTEELGEQARQRQWRTAGDTIPEHYDYVEERADDSPMSRTERVYVSRQLARNVADEVIGDTNHAASDESVSEK